MCKHSALCLVFTFSMLMLTHQGKDVAVLDVRAGRGLSQWLEPHLCESLSMALQLDPENKQLSLTVIVATIDAQWEGMGDVHVGLARYEPALLPPCLTIRVLRYSN